MGGEWERIARDLAAVVRRAEALEQERGRLAVERVKLERRLAEMLDATERRSFGSEATAVPCPSGCLERQRHTHYADGVSHIWGS